MSSSKTYFSSACAIALLLCVATSMRVYGQIPKRDAAAGTAQQAIPSVVVNVGAPSARSDEAKAATDESWWHRLWTDPVATFTGALFLATGALIIVGAVQLREMRSTSRNQLRAYVHVYPGFLWEQDERVHGMYEARPKIKNNGQTPAHHVNFRGVTRVLPIPIPADFDYALMGGPPGPGASTLGPGQDIDAHPATERLYTQQELEAILRGNGGTLYTYGALTYRDAFGALHTTRFCYAFIWGSRGFPLWVMHGPHNDAT